MNVCTMAKEDHSLIYMEHGYVPLEPLPPPSGDALLKAAWLGRLKLTRLLVDGGSNVNAYDENGHTTLMVAVLSSYTDAQTVDRRSLALYLLERKADPNMRDKNGKSLLVHVCQNKIGVAYVKMLLDFGADPHTEDYFGYGPLFYAAQSGDKDVLSMIAKTCRERGKEVIVIMTSNKEEYPELVTGKASPEPLLPPITDKTHVGQSTGSSQSKLINFATQPESENLVIDVSKKRPIISPLIIGMSSPINSLATTPSSISPVKTIITPSNIEHELEIECPIKSLALLSKSDSKAENELKQIPMPLKASNSHPTKILIRRNTTEVFSSLVNNKPLSSGPATLLQETDLDEVKLALLKWERELPYSVVLRSRNPQCSPLPLTDDMIPGRRLSRQEETKSKSPRSPRTPENIYSEEEENADVVELLKTKYPKDSKHAHKRMIGPGGKILHRQGSATKLLDVISHTRPGTLPALNVNLNPPIPDIGSGQTRKLKSQVSETEEESGDTFDTDKAEGVKLLESNTKRKLLYHRSHTSLQLCEVQGNGFDYSRQMTVPSSHSSYNDEK